MMDLVKEGAPKEQPVARLKLDDLGWAHSDSISALKNSMGSYCDEMAFVAAAQAAGPAAK